MHIVRQGYPFITGALVLAVVCFIAFGIHIAVIPVVLACYFAYFFRNPERTVNPDASLLYSPADGTVMGVTEFFDEEFLNAKGLQCTCESESGGRNHKVPAVHGRGFPAGL